MRAFLKIQNSPQRRESLDTERFAFRMCTLWEGEIERDTIAKLNGSSWSNGCRITSSGGDTLLSTEGYLATESAGRQVRLRKAGKTRSLTFKVGRGSHREEREVKLSPKQFATLWPGTAGRRLRKVRYEIPWGRSAD